VSRPARVAAALLAVLAWGPSVHAQPAAAQTAGAQAVVERLRATLQAGDLAGYLQLWEFKSAEARSEEETFVRERLATDVILVQLTAFPDPERSTVRASAGVLTVSEPRGRLEDWQYVLEQRGAAWVVVERETRSQVDALVHLSLDPRGLKADGLHVRVEDLDLEVKEGTIFLPSSALGPTAITFVGTATVRYRPRPAAEQEQLRQFCGRTELVDEVRSAFIRLHPADLRRMLSFVPTIADPAAPARLATANRVFRERRNDTYALDTTLPRSPWWLVPSLGDATIALETRRNGDVGFGVNGSQAEGLSFVDRSRRRQVNLYPAGGADTSYDEDARRSFDVLNHDLRVRLQPDRSTIEGEDLVTLRLVEASPTVQLRLDGALVVDSVTSAAQGQHVFLRLGGQNAVLVSLGAQAAAGQQVTLRVRYHGQRGPETVEHEVMQVLERSDQALEADVPIEDVLVYTNKLAWYPQGAENDYATATLRVDVPRGLSAVSGGRMSLSREEGGRHLQAFQLDRPAKYLSLAVGRLLPMARRVTEGLTLQAWCVPRLRDAVSEQLDQAESIARFYTSEFGPAPYPELNLVAIEGRTPGGHSPPGMVLLSIRPPMLRTALRDDPASLHRIPGFFLAHELAHQWWGQGVAGRNYRERWLSEGMAQYAAALWVRDTEGEAVFRDVLEHMGRWARTRDAFGPISLGQRLGHLQNDPQTFRAIVYDKAAYVLHMLRAIVGADAYRDALRRLQVAHRFGKMGTADLQQALEAASGRNLAPYFEAWIYGTGLPELRVTQSTVAVRGGFRTTVDVEASRLPGPVPATVTVDAGGSRSKRPMTLAPGRSTLAFDTATRPRRVSVNDDLGLLAVMR
jgi:hypothetical protein